MAEVFEVGKSLYDALAMGGGLSGHCAGVEVGDYVIVNGMAAFGWQLMHPFVLDLRYRDRDHALAIVADADSHSLARVREGGLFFVAEHEVWHVVADPDPEPVADRYVIVVCDIAQPDGYGIVREEVYGTYAELRDELAGHAWDVRETGYVDDGDLTDWVAYCVEEGACVLAEWHSCGEPCMEGALTAPSWEDADRAVRAVAAAIGCEVRVDALRMVHDADVASALAE